MATGFVVFLLMGLLGLLMRLDHGGILVLSADWFYRIMTLHGSGMVAASLLAAMGGLAAVLGQTLRLSTRWLATAFVVYFLGAGFVIIATLLGGFGGGWTALHQLPFKGFTWGLWAALAMLVGYLFVAVGFLIYCWLVLYTTVKRYGGLHRVLAWRYLVSGGRQGADSLPGPSEIAASVVAIVGTVAVLAGAAYLVPLFGEAAGLVGSLDALVAKNLLFLFGHTLVNLNIYLAAGLVYATLPLYTGREWKTTWPVTLALNLVLLLVLLPYFHHLYQDFVQALPLHILGQIGSYGVALPAFLVTIFGGLSMIYRSGFRWSVPSILMVAGLWGWTFGGLGALLDSTIGINQVMHNTLWVPAHFHTYYLLGALAFAWAYLYHLLGELSGASESRLGSLAAWLYGIGGAGFILTFFVSGAASVPRRYAVHIPEWQVYAQASVPFVLVLMLGIGWLAVAMLGRFAQAWQKAGA
ncbi:MAG: cbb3-type cytochrome c oxidase subunit I [Chloroflexi bacterium]|nr:cbb3-type cytochrome c oxidase subunit I [Chloroflexota bacterium]